MAELETPEGVVLGLPLAGLGSRFIGEVIDLCVQVSILGVLLIVLSFFAAVISAAGAGEGFLIALGFITVFGTTYGFETAFETLRNGQTPGKQVTGIRVVFVGGSPIDFKAAAIRNLVGIVEGPMTLWIVGAMSILISPKNQRLGDLAAGTIVVRERDAADANRPPPLPPGHVPPPPPPESAEVTAATADLGGVDDADIGLVQEFLSRRRTLDPAARTRLAAQLADRLEPRVAGLQREAGEDERFLEDLLSAAARRT